MRRPKLFDRLDAADLVRVVMFVAGIALISYGAWSIYRPAGFIAGGILMFGCAVAGAVRSGVTR